MQRLLFANNLVLLEVTQKGLQQALDEFLDACSVAEMKISTTKIETMCLSRQPRQCFFQIGGIPLKQSKNASILASPSQVIVDKIANGISASEKQVQ